MDLTPELITKNFMVFEILIFKLVKQRICAESDIALCDVTGAVSDISIVVQFYHLTGLC